MSTEHAKKAAIFNKDREKTTWHDQTFWSVRMKHDTVAHQLPEWEDLRQHASDIKRHTITHLADYLEAFTSNLESRGVIVHWANDADEFNAIVYDILKSHGVKKMVKSKSMLTEECQMNPYLIDRVKKWEECLKKRAFRKRKETMTLHISPDVHVIICVRSL